MKSRSTSFLSMVAAFAVAVSLAAAQSVFINEIHYDNVSGDVNEGVEIAGPAGTDLTGWSVVGYNGSGGGQYSTTSAPAVTIPDQQGGYGTVWVAITGLQNGSPDGVALVDSGSNVIQFLSYEGTILAADGPAIGMSSVDIVVVEGSATPTTHSLQLVGTGADYTDFSWSGPMGYTHDAVNTGQTFVAPPPSGDDPDASLLPTGLNYGVIVREATSDLSVYVVNDGASTSDLDITGVNFGGADPSYFSVVTALPITGVAPGTSASLTLQYDPANVNGADHSATATLVCNDPNPPSLTLAGKTYLDVADLAAARAQSSGTAVRVTGTVTVNSPTNGLNLGRNQLGVQDTSGTDGQTGILIDDTSYNLGADYSVGDQLQNLTGSLTTYASLLELVPTGPASLVGSGASVTPLVLAGTEALADIESELIRINTVSITTADVVWTPGGSGKNYNLDVAVGAISAIRAEEGSAVAGQTIPTGNFDMIGLAGRFNSQGQIQPRFAGDVITPATRVVDWYLMD